MGLQKHKKKYLFIADDIIELQMFQGYQNWSWISQGVLSSNFIALPGIPGGREIQLYSMLASATYIHVVHVMCTCSAPEVYSCFHHRACSSTQVNFPTSSDRMNNLETALN